MDSCEQLCNCAHGSTLFDQSLSELEFERGIWQAAVDNDLNKIKSLLQKGYNINARDSSGYTALHYAARNKHEKCVEYLLENGGCVNCVTKSGKDTPLHRAAYVGNLNIVKKLVEHGAKLEIQNTDGQTCLHKAVQNNHFEVVRYILTCVPSLENIKDLRNKTAMEYCCSDNL